MVHFARTDDFSSRSFARPLPVALFAFNGLLSLGIGPPASAYFCPFEGLYCKPLLKHRFLIFDCIADPATEVASRAVNGASNPRSEPETHLQQRNDAAAEVFALTVASFHRRKCLHVQNAMS